MPQLNNLYVVANAAGECSYIAVSDDNNYPVTLDGSDYNQDELAYAIAIYRNGTIQYMNVSAGSAWAFTIIPGQDWDVYVYACKVFTSADKTGAGTAGTIYWRYQNFWQKLADVVVSSPGDDADPLEWTMIDIAGAMTISVVAALFLASLVTDGHGIGFKVINVSSKCQGGFTVVQNDCHQWTITNSAGYTINSATLYKYDGTTVQEDLTFDDNELAITLEEDGVYFVQIEHSTIETAFIPIFDLCEAKTCYKNLFRYYMCACDDPCDENCAEAQKISQREKDLKLIQGAIMQIEMMVYMDRSQYFDSYTMEDTREAFITEVGVLVEKLKLATSRCGLCEEEESNDITC